MLVPDICWFLVFIAIGTAAALSISTEETNFRLPNNHVPESYDLTLTLNPEFNKFSGKVIIDFETKNKTNHFLLHASPSRITKITALLNYANPCTSNFPNKTTEILDINCAAGIPEGNNKMAITYEGLHGTANSKDAFLGFYQSSYETKEGLKNYSVTQFEPTFARTAFPCFDEPRFKAEFQLTITHPSSYGVLGNSEIVSQNEIMGIVNTKFKKTPAIATYLVAFVVSNFERTSSNSSVANINIFSRSSQSQNKKTAIQYIGDLVEALGTWTDIKYTDLGISKLDIVAVPHFVFGAMENWGLITFQEVDLLDEGDKTSAEDKQNIIAVMAHELAHQWFGDYVTLDWWSNAWLNEGFATYFEYHIPDKVKTLEMELGRQFILDNLHVAFESDGAEAPPMSSPYEDVNSPTESLSKFDEISYNKGASVIRMMESILGEENFREGLQSYLQVNAYKNSNPTKLLEALAEQYENKSINFIDVMKTWIYQSGYPIVTASLNETTNVLKINQNEFPSTLEKKNKTDKVWKIPITFATSKSSNFTNKNTQWLTDKKSLEIKVGDVSWVLLNLEQTGYYRVNYDDTLWQRITLVLNTNEMRKIHVSNRAQLLDDAFSLAKVGKSSYRVAFNLASYLIHEHEYEPWHVAAKTLKYISRMLDAHEDSDALANLQKVVLRWLNGAFPSGKKGNATNHLEILTNQVVYDLKCHMGHADCLKNSQEILRKFITVKTIDDYNTRKTALCYGLKNSKTVEVDYETLLNYYGKCDSALERRAILSSLGCLEDSTTLKKYLSELISNETVISRTDVKYVFRAIASNSLHGLEVMLPFLKDHLKDVLDRYSGLITLSNLILEPAKWVVSDTQLKQLKEITEKYKKIDGMDEVGKKALELPSIYNQWFAANRKDIESVLKSMINRSVVILPSIVMILSFLFIVKL